MKKSRDLNKLYELFAEVIYGIEVDGVSNDKTNKREIKKDLYDSLLKTSDQILDKFQLTDINGGGTMFELVESIYKAAVKIEPEDCSFYPLQMIKTGKATCAGQTMVVNLLLQKYGVSFEYGRPAGHSMNFVYLDDKTYWLDSGNAVFIEIEYSDEIIDGTKIRTVVSNHPKIPYRLIRMLNPEEITIAIFGNFLALIDWAINKRNEYAIEIYSKNKDLIDQVDLEYWLFYLYEENMKYTTKNKQFAQEVKRISSST